MKPLVIFGGSPFGRLVRVLAEDAGFSVLGFIDDFSTGPDILGDRSALRDDLGPESVSLAMAIGYSHLEARLGLLHQYIDAGFDCPPIIHPRAFVSRHASIEAGCLLMAGASVDAFATIGLGCVLWPGSIVSHDCAIGPNTFISPNATLCGHVQVGHSTFVGAGSVIVNGISVPEHSFVKAGARLPPRRFPHG